MKDKDIESKLLKKYCKKMCVPVNGDVKKTMGFVVYKLNYQIRKIASVMGKELRECGKIRWKN